MVILYSRTIAIWPGTTSPEVRIMSLLFLENWIAFVVVCEDGKGMCLQVKSDPRLERVPIMYRRAQLTAVSLNIIHQLHTPSMGLILTAYTRPRSTRNISCMTSVRLCLVAKRTGRGMLIIEMDLKTLNAEVT